MCFPPATTSMTATMSNSSAPNGPPYFPGVALVGLRPTTSQDVPACAVLIAVYLAAAIGHQIVFQQNRRKGHKFLPSWAMFGFGMARVATLVLRIAWATRLSNVSLAIAALIFTNIGILIVYVVNLMLSLRVLRALQPKLGWNRLLDKLIKASYMVLAVAIILVIAFTVLSFYTLNADLRTASFWVQRSGILCMLIFNVESLALLLLSVLLPRSSDAENFGSGSMRAKLIILATAMFFTVFLAGFRTGTTWSDARPLPDPAWYDSRGAFYGIELGFEIVIIYLFLFTRFDQRFWVPNGSKKPGDYSSVKRLASPRQSADFMSDEEDKSACCSERAASACTVVKGEVHTCRGE